MGVRTRVEQSRSKNHQLERNTGIWCLTHCVKSAAVIAIPACRWYQRFPWVQWAARWHAQRGSINCGHLTTADGVPHIDPNAAIQCALRAHERRQPFYITFDVYGVDEQISNGIVGDSQGNAIEIFYASGMVTPPANTLLRHRCPTPTRLKLEYPVISIPRLPCEPTAAHSLEKDRIFW